MAEQTTVGGFPTRRIIGRGAGSVIYEVEDNKTGSVYALKRVVRHANRDDRFIDQAVTEHDFASKVTHPNLRRSYRIIRKRSFLRTSEVLVLMEYVPGVNLEDAKLESMAALVQVFKICARGLDAIHQAGFVHADFKPRNVIIAPDGAVKLIDFGQVAPSMSRKERIQGTPDYIAPEQVHKQHLTPRTDVFNLGASIYRCVTGRTVPTLLDDAGASGELRKLNKIPEFPPPREVNPDVPTALNGLVLDCLQVRPEHRPPSMKEVRARLNVALYQAQQEAGSSVPVSAAS